jgi:hypothetical protein
MRRGQLDAKISIEIEYAEGNTIKAIAEGDNIKLWGISMPDLIMVLRLLALTLETTAVPEREWLEREERNGDKPS